MKTAKYILALLTIGGLILPWYSEPGSYTLNGFFVSQASFVIVHYDSRESLFKAYGIVVLLCTLLALGLEFYGDKNRASRKYGFIPMLGAVIVMVVALLSSSGASLGVEAGLYLSLLCGGAASALMLHGSGLFTKERHSYDASISESRSDPERPGVAPAVSHPLEVDKRTSMTAQSNVAQGDAIAPSSLLDLNTESSSIAERNRPDPDAGDRLGAQVAELPDVSDERVNRLLNGLQDRMAYKREAALNEIGREKLIDPRIVGTIKTLAASDRVDTIREIAQRVLDSLDLGELRNDTGEEPATMPAAVPSPPAAPTTLSGARSHQNTPRLLILLVDKMPPGGPESHIRRLLNDLSAQEIPEDVVLQVTESYADQGYIAAKMTFTPVQQGIRADDNKTWYRSYSTADGITGTQVFIYE